MKKAVRDSVLAKRMRKSALGAIQQTATDSVDFVKSVTSATTIDELEQLTGQTIDRSKLDDAGSEEPDAAKLALAQVQQDIKKKAVDVMQDRVQELDVSEDNPYYKIYTAAIEAIVKA